MPSQTTRRGSAGSTAGNVAEPLAGAGATRVACTACGLWGGCQSPGLLPFVPKAWVARGRRYLLVGEAPGKEEDTHGRPFIGPAGQLLRDLWQRAGIDDADVALVNAVRCRTPRNATPTMRQVRACRPFLLRVLEVAQPSFVVALGVTAAKALANDGSVGSISGLRGRRLEIPGLAEPHVAPAPICWATYHPAAILHGNTVAAGYIVEDLARTWWADGLAGPTDKFPVDPMGIAALDTEFAPDNALLTVAFAGPTWAVASEPPGPEVQTWIDKLG